MMKKSMTAHEFRTQSPTEKQPASISAKRVVVTSFIVDLIDIVLSLIVTVLSGSVVMLAQALQGVADLSASGLLILGVARSKKPPDRTYPFGYGREIYFWAMLAALLTFTVTAGFSFYFGWQRFFSPQPLDNLFLAYLVLALTTLTNSYALSLSYKRLLQDKSQKGIWQAFFNSPLVETKTTFVLDLMGTTASILGFIFLLIFGLSGDLRFDGLGAMFIGIALAILAFFLIKAIKDFLVGKSASVQTENRIRQLALDIPGVNSVLDLKTLYVGGEKLLVNIEVHLKDGLTTDEIEVLIDKIKAKVQSEIPIVVHMQIELETP